jgi:hypothetical protein
MRTARLRVCALTLAMCYTAERAVSAGNLGCARTKQCSESLPRGRSSANPTDRAMPSHPFGKWWQNFFTYKAVQNPYRRIPIFMAVYKGRKEIRRIPESATPDKIQGKARFILSRSCNYWSWLTNVRKVCRGYIYLLKIFYLLRS